MKKNKVLPPRSGVVIGVPVYNGGLFLREALDDLQRQTYRNFRVVIVDDGSTHNSDSIIKDFLNDSRFYFERLPSHRGKIGAWKKTIKIANAIARPKYFAFYSDHNRVDRRWLGSLLDVLEKDPRCACAYAKTQCIGVDGKDLPSGDGEGIHTQGLPVWKRIKLACAPEIGAEKIAYGLFRTEVLEKCGWFRDEIFPEQLLASEVNVYGSVARVDSVTRYNRLTSFVLNAKKTIVRQSLELFPPGSNRTGLASSHSTLFLRNLFPSTDQDGSDFVHRLVHAVLYFSSSCSSLRSVLVSELRDENFPKNLKPFKKLIHLSLGGLFSDSEGSSSLSQGTMPGDFSHESVVARFPMAKLLGPLAVPGYLLMRSAKVMVGMKKVPALPAKTHLADKSVPKDLKNHNRPPLRLVRRESSEPNNAQVYKFYQDVRNKIKAFTRSGANSLSSPSQYWTEELSNFDYMMEASPLIIRKLRHHCFHITGLRVYDYRTNKTKEKAQLLDKLHSLQSLDTGGDLLVPEPRAMGGFGFEFEGNLFNVDTLKYYEVLIGLERSGLLQKLRSTERRKLVWEVGAGWGGFPYQFKTIVPNVTYVIVDLPELFLFSAVYLRALFPKARMRICTNIPVGDIFSNWENYDFIFIPNTLLSKITFPRVDLMINMVSFQEMTEDQVDAYVKKAAESRSPHIYSLNMWKPKYNSELADLNVVLSRYYNTKRVHLLNVGYNILGGAQAPSTGAQQNKDAGQGLYDSGYIHVMGDLCVGSGPESKERREAVSSQVG